MNIADRSRTFVYILMNHPELASPPTQTISFHQVRLLIGEIMTWTFAKLLTVCGSKHRCLKTYSMRVDQ